MKCLEKMRLGALASLCALLALGGMAAPPAWGDASANADSRNFLLFKYSNLDGTNTTFWNAESAAAARYQTSAVARNEVGSSGIDAHAGLKFGPGPTGITWTTAAAAVPPPGTTVATAVAKGQSYVLNYGGGFDLAGLAAYHATGAAVAFVRKSSIPAGGFGNALAEVDDPWPVSLPFLPADGHSSITVNGNNYTSSTTDSVDMHAYLDMSGASMSADATGHASINFHVAMDGVNATYTDHLLDYTVTEGVGNTFGSTLHVAPGVQIFVNDFTTPPPPITDPNYEAALSANIPPDFDAPTLMSPSQLKTYLDGFQTSSGWSTLHNEVFLGMNVSIPNAAVGIDPSDTQFRHFAYSSDVIVVADDATPVPEPGTLLLLGTGLIGLLGYGGRLTRRASHTAPLRTLTGSE